MKVKVGGLYVLNVEQKGEEQFDIDGNIYTVAPHILYTCYSASDNTLVKFRDFTFTTKYAKGEVIDEEEVDIYLRKIDKK